MIPHTLALEPGLKIYKIYNGYWYWGRPTIEELRHDLRAITRNIRPDWDITTPELREAWQRVDRRAESFYPYGKTMAEVFSRWNDHSAQGDGTGRRFNERNIDERKE